MRGVVRTSLLVVIGFLSLTQGAFVIEENSGKSAKGNGVAAAGTAGGGAAALLGALEGALGKGQDKTVTMTVTKSAVGAANQSTVTVTQQAQAAGLAAVTQLSFLTSTVFGTGVAPTVTITALPQMITQFVTITQAAAAAEGSPVAVSSPSSAVKSAVSSASSAISNGNGTLLANGACDCACLCGAGSFNFGTMANIGPVATTPTTLVTSVSPTVVALSSTNLTTSEATTAARTTPPSSAPSTLSTTSSTPNTPSSVATSSTPVGQSEVSSIELSIAKATTTSTAPTDLGGAAVAQSAQATTLSIDIATFSLSSSLVLGNLATATIKV